jgi:cytochrome c556
MVYKLLVIFAVYVSGVIAAAAQGCQNTISIRQELMKKSGEAGKLGAAMIKGEAPFDLAKAKQILATFADDAGKMPTLFPECSRIGEHTSAAPAIWEDPGDFKAAMAKFAADVKAAQENTKDLETFKASFQSIGKDCGGCHEKYRVKKS